MADAYEATVPSKIEFDFDTISPTIAVPTVLTTASRINKQLEELTKTFSAITIPIKLMIERLALLPTSTGQ